MTDAFRDGRPHDRYVSGTQLERTNKEMELDWLERELGEISDELFIGLKKLSILDIKLLKRAVISAKEDLRNELTP